MKTKTWILLLLLLLKMNKNGVEGGGGGGFIRVKGLHFVVDGKPFLGNGFNAYWLMIVAANPSQRPKVTAAFQQAAAHGLSVARTWAFSDGGPASTALQYSPGSYNEQMFKGLDFVVSEARRFGIRLILSLVNNYESFGGKKQYVEWARLHGQRISDDDGFFTDPLAKSFYKNHVKTVLTRRNTVTGVAYKDEPTIFAWELMNEPRCPSDPSGRAVQGWITEMAAHVKSVDGSHLLEAGTEGFYGRSSPAAASRINPAGALQAAIGTDFISNNMVSGIDFATVHSYPDQWMSSSSDEEQLSFLNSWLDAHIRDAGGVIGKPLMVTEFGKSDRDSRFTTGGRDALFSAVYIKIYQSARSGGPVAGGLFWQLLAQGMGPFGDGYEVVFGEDPSTATVIASECRKLRYLGRRMLLAAGDGRRSAAGEKL